MNETQPEEYDPFTDVTRLLGTNEACLERDLFDLYRAHFERAKAHPSLTAFRLCVESHDAFMECFHGVRP